MAAGAVATAAALLLVSQVATPDARLETGPASGGETAVGEPDGDGDGDGDVDRSLGVEDSEELDPSLPVTGQPTSTSTSASATATPPASTASTPAVDTTSSSTSGTTTSGVANDPLAETIDSPCGTVVVRVVGTDVEFVEALPQTQFDVDVKKRGPEKVEVSFEGSGGHCEIKAEWRDGELQADVESE